ncbi:unnamed protein product, partial [Ectocarpus sp. 12 AP-2014]
YVVDGVKPDSVRSIIDSAIAQFESFQALRTELVQTRNALEDRKIIERAKGLIMKREGCDEDTAFQILRSTAMDHSERLSDMARRIIALIGEPADNVAIRQAS